MAVVYMHAACTVQNGTKMYTIRFVEGEEIKKTSWYKLAETVRENCRLFSSDASVTNGTKEIGVGIISEIFFTDWFVPPQSK